ncbi:MAG: hypothetical protein JNM50_06885 [Chromatiales bacterium]|nr:hypothetical protein [Chromatiales bacterium]
MAALLLLSAGANLLGAAAPAYAVTTPVIGQLGSTIQTCLQLLTVSVSDGENCTYGGSVGPGFPIPPAGEEIGPTSFGYYYSSATKPEAWDNARTFVPTVGDGKLNAKIEGTITVDQVGASPTDHLISFSLTISDPNGGKVIRILNAVVERFDTVTQTLAPRKADSASSNSQGGFDYVIGTAGFPSRLTANNMTACEGQAFGTFECAASFTVGPDTNKWANWPGSAGLGSLEGNLGAKTTGTVTGLECTAGPGAAAGAVGTVCSTNHTAWNPVVNGPNSTGGGSSPTERGAAEDVGWDQLLLKVSTDANGFVTAVEGFDVEEYRVFGQTRCGDNTTGTGTYTAVCNSWHASYFSIGESPPPGPQAVDDTFTVSQGLAANTLDVLANDADFAAPAATTVSIVQFPAQGIATVNLDGTINYNTYGVMPGTVTFTYQACDGSGCDAARVTVTVEAIQPPSISLLSPVPSVLTPSSGGAVLELFGDFTGLSMLGGGVDFAVNGPATIIGFTPSQFTAGLDPAFTGWGSELADNDFEVHLGSFTGFTGLQKLGDLSLAFTGIEYGPVQIDLSIATLFGGFFTTDGNPITVALQGASFTFVPDAPTLVLPGTVTAADAVAGTVISGTAGPGLSVQVSLGGVSKSAVADGAGAWSLTWAVGELPGDGPQPVEAFAFDGSGNISPAATGQVLFTIGATAALAIDAIATDDVVNAEERAAGVVITGTATPGAPVTVSAAGQQWSTTAVANPLLSDAFDGPVEEGLVGWDASGGLVSFPAGSVGLPPIGPGGPGVVNVQFHWATDGLARGWTSSAANSLPSMTNGTYFSDLAGNNSTTYYNPDFAKTGDATGWCGPGTEAFQAQYACKISTTSAINDIGPGAKAIGQVTVTGTTMTGTLTVINTNDEGVGPQPGTTFASGYNVRSAEGSPFKNVWYGVSNQMTLTVNLTGTFTATNWEITGGTVSFFDPAFQCGVADFSGVLCNPSTVGGGFQANGQMLSWGMAQGSGPGTGVSDIRVFDPTGATQLATLSGVRASVVIDGAGNITTVKGETRTGSGSGGGGCATSVRWSAAAGITCGTLAIRKLDISGLSLTDPVEITCAGGAGGCVALNVSGGSAGRIVSVQDVNFFPGREYVLEARVAGHPQGSSVGGVVLGLVDATTGAVVRSETFTGIVPGQPFAPYSISWFGSDLPPGPYRVFVAAQAGTDTAVVVDDVRLRDTTLPTGGQPDVGYWSINVATGDLPADGPYDAIAAIGSAASVSRGFTVDTTPPPAPQVDVLDNAGNLDFSPQPADGTRQISVNGTPVAEYQPPAADGTYDVRVCDSDAAGNTSCTEVQFVVDLSPRPADDTAEVIAGRTVSLAVLANDDLQRTPVTVSLQQAPALGNAAVTGSPGQPAAIAVQYTAPATLPAGQLRVTDTFVYRASDGTTGRDATVTVTVVRDTDGDTVPDYRDNCVNTANTNQRDTRNSGIGNICNGDLKNKGTTPNFEDLAIFRTRFGTTNADADLDGNGVVNFGDLAIFRQLFARPLPPPLPLALPAGFAIPPAQSAFIDVAQIPGVRIAGGVVAIGSVPYGYATVSGTTVTYSPGGSAPPGPVDIEYTITDSLGRFSTAVLTAQVGAVSGPFSMAQVTFTWAVGGQAKGWSSSAANSLGTVANGTYFTADTSGANSTTYYNADFAKAGDPTGWCGPGTEAFQAQYACKISTNTPVADIGPGAQATGTLSVTPTTLTGTLVVVSTSDEGAGPQPGTSAVSGYNIRSADGSPFKNVWYGVSNQMTLTVNLTGTFTDSNWQITGGTVSFNDPAFQCAVADFSGVLCNPSTVGGGFTSSGSFLSWGIDQASGAATPVGPIPVFDAAGGTLLATLSGVLASVNIDATGNLSTNQGEVRTASGSAGGGCPTSLRYSGNSISCGTLQASPLVITGKVSP